MEWTKELLEIDKQKNELATKRAALGVEKGELQRELTILKSTYNWNSSVYIQKRNRVFQALGRVDKALADVGKKSREFATRENELKYKNQTAELAVGVQQELESEYQQKLAEACNNIDRYQRILNDIEDALKPVLFYSSEVLEDKQLDSINGKEIWRSDLTRINRLIKKIKSEGK